MIRVHGSLVDVVVLVRDKAEPTEEIVRAVMRHTTKEPDNLQSGCTECSMARWVGREGRREVLGRRVRLGRPQRQPTGVAIIGKIVVTDRSQRPHRLVIFADAYNRSPEVVNVLLILGEDARIAHRRVDQCEQAGILLHREFVGKRQSPHNLVIEARWRA